MTLTKADIVELITEKVGGTKSESNELVELMLDTMKDRLSRGENVLVSGFGKWSARDKKARKGRNPKTGEDMEISARRVVTFSASDTLREAVNVNPPD